MPWQMYTALIIYCLLLIVPVARSSSIEDIDGVIDDALASVALVASVVLESNFLFYGSRSRIFVRRKRKFVKTIFEELGPYHVRRSYRMKEATFWKLNSILLPYLPKKRKRKRGWTPNGPISSSHKLSMAISYLLVLVHSN